MIGYDVERKVAERIIVNYKLYNDNVDGLTMTVAVVVTVVTCDGRLLWLPGETALTYGAAAGNDVGLELVIRSFRRLGLDVDHVTKSGRTALLIAVSRGHVECAAILAADGRADTRLRDPVTGLTADQLALTCTGYPLKRPSPPDSTSGGASSGRRGTTRAPFAKAGRKDAGGCGVVEEVDHADGDRKTYDSGESFRRRFIPTGNGRPLRRSSLPSMKIRFDDPLTSPSMTVGRSSAIGRNLSREQTTTTTVDDDELSG